ncbi:MAG: ATP-dependent helicase [Phycisphaeraceae bacterium]|nr:ATP-dependent helicase [Phycisphaeraceae bacterium]
MNEGLNEAQRAAVEHEGGPLIVLAGPGTGKTRVIVHRVAHLIAERGVEPESVLAATYTVKAAEELRERLAGLIGAGVADRVRAHTIHGFGHRVVRRFPDLLGLWREPELIDSAQQRRLMRSLIVEHRVYGQAIGRGHEALIEEAERHFEAFRNAGLTPGRCEDFARAWADRIANGVRADGTPVQDERKATAEREAQALFAGHTRLFGLFEAACRERCWMTFADLVAMPAELLRGGGRAAALLRDECRHIVVDEFQDVNRAQVDLLRLLAPPEANPDLVVVGDDDQAIYGFRGADDRAFQRFASVWRQTRTIALTINYRSEQPVIVAANAVISLAEGRFAPDKEVELPEGKRGAAAPAGSVVEGVLLEDDAQGADVIAAMIASAKAADPSRAWREVAILARTKLDLDRIAVALRIEGVPFQLRREGTAADDEGVKDLLAWVELLVNPTATWAARRLLVRPPFSVGREVAIAAEALYSGRATRAEMGDGDAPPGYVEWLAANEPDNPGVSRFVETARELASFAATASAASAIYRIVTRCDLAHADLLPARERARRVSCLVAAVRFARSVQGRLDAPGDLASFLSYYQDLSEREQGFVTTGWDRVDQSEDEEETEDAVQVLTAHSAKGLEFDEVFIARVNPQHGFPKLGGDEWLDLPAGLLDDDGERRSAKERARAEERRLFYVACTRARRRLVLLSKRTKTRSKSTHYFQELQFDSPGLIVIHDAADVLARAAEHGVGMLGRTPLDREAPEFAEAARRRDEAAAARRAARLEAAGALDSIDRPRVTAEEFAESAARLREAAMLVATAAHAQRTGRAPTWAEGESERVRRTVERLTRGAGAAQRPDGRVELRPMRSSLSLSFTFVNDYQRCPRCFFVKHVLKLAEEEGSGVTAGQCVHGALERFYTQWRDAEAEGRTRPGLADLLEMGRRAYFGSLAPGERADPGALDETLAMLRTAYERLHEPTVEVLEVERFVTMPYAAAGAEHRLTAKIDRIDRVEGGVRIVDYKSGQATARYTEPEADDLQLGIYAMAAEQLYPGASGTAEYWMLRTGERGTIALADLDVAAVRAAIDEVVRAVLAGQYPPGKKCGGACEILGEG